MTKLFPTAKYSFDTSAFVDTWRRYYPPDVFPTIWQKIDALCAGGVIIASREVMRELEKKDDDLLKHLKQNHRSTFIEFDQEQQIAAGALVNKHSGWVDPQSTRNNADPYDVALAQVEGVTV